MSREKDRSKLSNNSRKWRKLLFCFLIICLLSYFISLIILNSSWFKEKISSKLDQRIPADWKIGGITWVPLGDVTINDVKSSLGVGGVHFKTIKIAPSWGDLLTGDFTLNDLSINEGHLSLDTEWLKEHFEQSPEAKLIQQLPNSGSAKKDLPKKAKPRQKLKPKSTKVVDNKDSLKRTPSNTNTEGDKQAINKLSEEPNKWLNLNNFTISILNKGVILERIEGVNLSIPVAGKPNKGEVSFTVLGKKIIQEVQWDGAVLSAENLLGEQFGFHFQWLAMCDIKQQGLPFRFNFLAPKQKLNVNIDKPNLHWSIIADEATIQMNISGGLKQPNSWKGIMLANTLNVVVSENQKTNQREHFDHMRLVANYRRGAINITIAEAIGNDTSILANGVIRNNLYSYGVVRLITNERSRIFFNRLHRGTRALHIKTGRVELLQRFDTLDRAYCDIYLDGPLTDLEVRHNRSDRWQKLKLVIESLMRFKDNELKEDGILEESS